MWWISYPPAVEPCVVEPWPPSPHTPSSYQPHSGHVPPHFKLFLPLVLLASSNFHLWNFSTLLRDWWLYNFQRQGPCYLRRSLCWALLLSFLTPHMVMRLWLACFTTKLPKDRGWLVNNSVLGVWCGAWHMRGDHYLARWQLSSHHISWEIEFGISVRQWLSTESRTAPQELFGKVWRHFFHVTTWEAHTTGVREQRSGLLPNPLQCTGQLPLWRASWPQISAAPGLRTIGL